MYNTNLKNFAYRLLPNLFRGSFKELVYVCIQPFRVLQHKIAAYRIWSNYRLRYNACVGSMQAFFNHRFADMLHAWAQDRAIVVEDSSIITALMVYPEAEHRPIMVGDVMVRPYADWGVSSILVKIPIELQPYTDLYNEVEYWVRQYKLTGTKYEIKYY